MPDAKRGRKAVYFDSRKCRDCNEVWPYEAFVQVSNYWARGYQLRSRCPGCHRKFNAESKRKARLDDEYRLLDNARRRARGYSNNDSLYISCWQWVKYRMAYWHNQGCQSVVAYLVPTLGPTPNATGDPKRWWVGKTWTFREERPGIVPPRYGIPIVRLSRQVCVRHPLCPDYAEIMVRIAINRHRLMFLKTPPIEQEGQ